MDINKSAVSNAKSLFIERGMIKANSVRAEIILSWERSRLQERVVGNIQHDKFKVEEWLVSGNIKKIFDKIFEDLGELTVFILDSGGNIIDYNIRHDDFHIPQSFIEGFAGTTAFSVTKKLGRQFTVYFSEHYKDFYSDYVSFCTKLPEAEDLRYKKELFILAFSKKDIDQEIVIDIIGNVFNPDDSRIQKKSLKIENTDIKIEGVVSPFDENLKIYLSGISREIVELKDKLKRSAKEQKFIRIDGQYKEECLSCAKVFYETWCEEEGRSDVQIISRDTDIAGLYEILDDLKESKFLLVVDAPNSIPMKKQIEILNLIEKLRKDKIEFKVVSIFYDKLGDEWLRETIIPTLHSLVACVRFEYTSIGKRTGDIAFVVKDFLRGYDDGSNAREFLRSHDSQRHSINMTNEFIKGLEKYDWPGGIAQLINFVEFNIDKIEKNGSLDERNIPKPIRYEKLSNNLNNKTGHIEVTFDNNVDNMKSMSKKLILEALKSSHGNITIAARNLGMGRTTLYRKMKEMNIENDVSKWNSVLK